MGFALVEVPLVESGLERAQMVAFAERMYEGPGVPDDLDSLHRLLPGDAYPLGRLMAGEGRATLVSALIVAGLLSEFVGTDAVSPELMYVLLLVSLGWVGLKILRISRMRDGQMGARWNRE